MLQHTGRVWVAAAMATLIVGSATTAKAAIICQKVGPRGQVTVKLEPGPTCRYAHKGQQLVVDLTQLAARDNALEAGIADVNDRVDDVEAFITDVAAYAIHAHGRINGLSLSSQDVGNEQFGCGGTSASNDPLAFLSGTRDGTGCGVPNLNYYRRLQLNIPPQ